MKTAKKALVPLLAELRAAGATEVTITFYGGGDEGSIDEVDGANGVDLVDWATDLLEEVGVDWYNNEGGNGEITINVTTGEVTYTVNQNEMISTEAASGSFTA